MSTGGYWWHTTGVGVGGGAVNGLATPASVAAVAATPTPTKRANAIAPLEFPTGLFISNLGETQLKVNWPTVPGASRYDVERNGVIIATDVILTQYDDSGLTPATTYRYRVLSKP